jgi:hypothetical protein
MIVNSENYLEEIHAFAKMDISRIILRHANPVILAV